MPFMPHSFLPSSEHLLLSYSHQLAPF
jgi:hypothetical protein